MEEPKARPRSVRLDDESDVLEIDPAFVESDDPSVVRAIMPSPPALPSQRVPRIAPPLPAARGPVVEPPAKPRPVAADADARLRREAEALELAFPTRAALVHAFRARAAADLHGDLRAAETACVAAESLAPGARFVALTRRWIAGLGGAPAAILAAARAEIPLAGDVPERVALLWQIAAVEAPDEAERTLRLLLDLDPHDLGAWIALAASAMQRRSWAVAAESWEAAAVRTEDLVARGVFHASTAGLRQTDRSDDEGARAALDRAFEADPTSVAALAGLESIQLHSGAIADHARMAAVEAQRVGDLDPSLGYHERAGDLYWECLRDSAAAAQAYERAAAVATADVVPLGKLAALHEQDGRYPALVGVYERLLERIHDPLRRGAVLLRLGSLYETRLDRPDDAIRCYRAALAVAPTLAPAAQALARLYQAHGRWDDVAAVLLVEVDRLADPASRAARFVAIAELLESHLGISAQIVTLHERALALDPGQVAALDALDRIHRAAGRWKELVALHEDQLAHTTHPMRVRALRLALAAMYLDRAAAPDKAAEQLRAALATPPDHFFTLVSLARALADAGKWAEHVAVLEEQAALLDGPELIATLHRIASVVEHRLADPARALVAYERVLALQPRHELAAHATLRLHLGQARWEDVIASERRLLELTERPEEAAVILHRIAIVAEDQLGRPDDAITAYETALVYLPSYRPARVALERLLRGSGRFDRLAGLLQEQATDAAGGLDRARLLCQAALVRELHLATPSIPSAASLYEEALALEPALPAALWGLQRIRIQAADWNGVAQTLGHLLGLAQHANTRARLLVQLGRLHEFRLGDPDRAAPLYAEARAAAPGPAIVFECLRVALARPGDATSQWLDEAAVMTSDGRLASGLLRFRASTMGRADRAAAAAAYAAALVHGTSPQVVEGLARNRTGVELAEALTMRAPQLKDAPTRALLHAIAGILLEPTAAADAAYRDALVAQPDFFPALDGRRRLAERAGDWQAAATICADTAASAQHPANKLELLEAAAEIFAERLGDHARAIGLYRDALAVEPGRAYALGRALELFERAGEWEPATALIGEQVGVVDDTARATLLARRARILADHLGNPDGAIADLERALVFRPADPELLARLAALHESLRHWADAAQVLDQLARLGDPTVRRDALLAHARIWITEVPDYARAQRILEDALQLDPADRAICARLAEAACLAGDTRRAADLYHELARRGPAVERVAALLAHVDLRRQLGEPDGDATAPGFELAFEDPAVIPMLEDHYRIHDNLAGYIAHAEAALARVLPTAAEAVPLRVSLGRVFGRELSAPERAIPYLHAAVAAAPANAQLRITLAASLSGRDDQAALGELRRAIEIDPLEPIAYRRLAELCARQGRELAAALLDTAAALLGADDELARAQIDAAALPAAVAASLPPDDALGILVGATRVPEVRAIVAHLDPYLHLLFPDNQEHLEGGAPLPDRYPITGMIRGIAGALAVPTLPLLWRERSEPRLPASEPRAFIIAPEHVAAHAVMRIRFDAGYSIARLAGGSLLGHVVPPAQVRALVQTITDRDADDAHDFRRRITQAVPRRARKDLDRLVAELPHVDVAASTTWETEERRRALGIGVIASGDLRVVARAICPDALTAGSADARRAILRTKPMILDALRFAASDACWMASLRFYGRP